MIFTDLVVSATSYGYVVEYNGTPRDFTAEAMAVTPHTALPLSRKPPSVHALPDPDVQAALQATGKQWARHLEEEERDVMFTGVLYYLAPSLAVCKTAREKERQYGETCPGVLVSKHGNVLTTLSTDEHRLFVAVDGHTICSFRYDKQMTEYHGHYHQFVLEAKGAGRSQNLPSFSFIGRKRG